MKTEELFSSITDRICAQLADGVRPWSKPWRDGVSPLAPAMPHNLVGRNYRGANVLTLWAVAQSMGYASPVWLTFKQAIDAGGSVRKGERGTPVFFWKFGVAEDKKTGETRSTCLARQYTVFNIAQCDGVTVPDRRQRVLTPLERHAEADRLTRSSSPFLRPSATRPGSMGPPSTSWATGPATKAALTGRSAAASATTPMPWKNWSPS